MFIISYFNKRIKKQGNILKEIAYKSKYQCSNEEKNKWFSIIKDTYGQNGEITVTYVDDVVEPSQQDLLNAQMLKANLEYEQRKIAQDKFNARLMIRLVEMGVINQQQADKILEDMVKEEV